MSLHTLAIGSGGVKVFCQLGACKAFFERILDMEEIGIYVGCSIGSVLSTLLACGYTPTEIFSEFLSANVEGLLQMGNMEDMIKHVGVFDHEPIKEYMKELIGRKLHNGDVNFQSFSELTGRDIYILAVNTDQTEKIIFSRKTTPHTPVIEAIIASCSIPFLIQGSEMENSIVIDGAAMDPIGLDIAMRVSRPGGKIYAMFFSGERVAEKILSIYIPERAVMEEILRYWGRTDILKSPEGGKSTLDKILRQGRKVYKCFTEALLENYIFRNVLENQISPEPRDIHLIPLPTFDIVLFSSPEMKVHMYYTGVDTIVGMHKQKYLL